MAHDYAKPKAGRPLRGSGVRGTKGGPAVSGSAKKRAIAASRSRAKKAK